MLEAEATVQTQSITTSEEKRDAHLRSAGKLVVYGFHTMIPKKLFVSDANTYWYRPR